ncbi:ROK family transcriptional regulator [Microbacterium esteraromaticum]|uniref:ROK family transcriptional regulator n=1 Tax=Microbacterium esteraromaticum TaxID=57043 RepID=A0A939ITW4_9MICO|nr:ROK family protein [Microbacterium esteraromaticum]MBN8204801.1 ROK family transcriptional regulator [Microbacterium esteraromaticum]MBN8414955.1 ROK family transcriptional regulator [Microbacterium esteraromaticum]MBN8424771.1 ROK family transcriptional regulator [Microbacterium esteraromaticum]
MSHSSALPIAVRAALHVRDHGSATVTEIAQTLELSRTSVENAMSTLTEAGLVADATVTSGRGAGRPARRFSFEKRSGFVVGVDVGVASVRVVVADLAGQVVRHESFGGVAHSRDGAEKLAVVIDDIRSTLTASAIPPSRVRAIGVSLPGIVDDSGRVTTSVVIPEWSGVDIGSQLASAFGCRVSVDNGVRLAAVAEHHLGVAQLVDDLLYLSVGNRIAMGLILGGRPRRGIHNAAGDIGRLAFPGLVTQTGQLTWRTGSDAESVFTLAREGDAPAVDELDSFIDQLAHGIATLVLTVDPAMVVIGGGLSAAHEQLLDPLRRALTSHIGLPFSVPLVGARLGAEAASHGALVFAFRRHAADIYGLESMPVPPITPLPADTAGTAAHQKESS